MAKKTTKITVQGINISITKNNEEDYISLTDMAKVKDEDNNRSDMIIQNWMRNKDTVEFIGLWETINNPDFKPVEFEGLKS